MKLSAIEPEVEQTDHGTMLRWRVPYTKPDGTPAVAYIATLATLEQYRSSPFLRSDVQKQLDDFLKTKGVSNGNEE